MTDPEPIPGQDDPALRVRAILSVEDEPESCLLEAQLTQDALAKLHGRDPSEFFRERLMRRAQGFPNDGFRTANINVRSPHVFNSRYVED
jgi:hypothetical protein